jgi:cytochrome c biogenesis protein CcmG/thiol:disulfide interchange protein DsbE
MKEYPYRKNRPFTPLPTILLAGLFIGIAASLVLFTPQSSPNRLDPTKTPAYRSSTATISTIEAQQVVEITPEEETESFASVGKPAPDFSLNTIDGKVVKLSDFKGKAVLINLWASWCLPCRIEAPSIQAAYEKYKVQGLVILGINYTVQDYLEDIKAFIREFKLTFPILLDETGDISTGLYGMRGLPTSYFIDTEGVLKRIRVGAMLPKKLDEYLTEILPK